MEFLDFVTLNWCIQPTFEDTCKRL